MRERLPRLVESASELSQSLTQSQHFDRSRPKSEGLHELTHVNGENAAHRCAVRTVAGEGGVVVARAG
jgi:hypothetical protein